MVKKESFGKKMCFSLTLLLFEWNRHKVYFFSLVRPHRKEPGNGRNGGQLLTNNHEYLREAANFLKMLRWVSNRVLALHIKKSAILLMVSLLPNNPWRYEKAFLRTLLAGTVNLL